MVDTRATGASEDGAVGRGGGAIPAVVNVEAEASDASDGRWYRGDPPQRHAGWERRPTGQRHRAVDSRWNVSL